MPTTTRAAVLRHMGAPRPYADSRPLSLETLTLDDPGPGEVLVAIKAAGLKVLSRIDAKPEHPKVADTSNPLHKARAAEVTSLWRLGAI